VGGADALQRPVAHRTRRVRAAAGARADVVVRCQRGNQPGKPHAAADRDNERRKNEPQPVSSAADAHEVRMTMHSVAGLRKAFANRV
jgi:hypothetical protein